MLGEKRQLSLKGIKKQTKYRSTRGPFINGHRLCAGGCGGRVIFLYRLHWAPWAIANGKLSGARFFRYRRILWARGSRVQYRGYLQVYRVTTPRPRVAIRNNSKLGLYGKCGNMRVIRMTGGGRHLALVSRTYIEEQNCQYYPND